MKDNKLLAEYLEYSIERQYSLYWDPHSDWNQLMMVVEKIRKEIPVDDFQLSFYSGSRKWRAFVAHSRPVCLGNTPIEAVYNACVEYIKNK